MSLNTAHVSGGVLIHAAETILLFSEEVKIVFGGQEGAEFLGEKTGKLFLTTHRVIFINNQQNNPIMSFSFVFLTLTTVELVKDYIQGKVGAQPGGNFSGEAEFKISFKNGGENEFYEAIMKAARMASHNYYFNTNDVPPPYNPSHCGSYAAPPQAYFPDPSGYSGWTPPITTFPHPPPANTVFMTDELPPFPGIHGNPSSKGGSWTNPNMGSDTRLCI